MSALESLEEAKVGQRVSFAYYGGENPGTTRLVDVEEIRNDRIIGMDVTKQEKRQYLFTKAAVTVVVVDKPQAPVAAEAVCDMELEPATRVRRLPMDFTTARDLLHQQIDSLHGEDLAEVLAEIQGEDRATFDANSGQVIMERDVLVPHCEVNMDDGHCGAAGIDWVNEDGERLTTTFLHDGDAIRLFNTDNEVGAEILIAEIAQHLGLTIS